MKKTPENMKRQNNTALTLSTSIKVGIESPNRYKLLQNLEFIAFTNSKIYNKKTTGGNFAPPHRK